jgi:hypothetical protein
MMQPCNTVFPVLKSNEFTSTPESRSFRISSFLIALLTCQPAMQKGEGVSATVLTLQRHKVGSRASFLPSSWWFAVKEGLGSVARRSLYI